MQERIEMLITAMADYLSCDQIKKLQKLLGHNQLDTTLIYAQVSQDNVKSAHQRYLG